MTSERQVVSPVQLREYKTVAHLVCALSGICAAAPSQVVTKLVNVLWDEDEAKAIQQVLKEMQHVHE